MDSHFFRSPAVDRLDLWSGAIHWSSHCKKEELRLAVAPYESLFDKLFTLSADARVQPTHGAGSLCGRSISATPSSTIGEELHSN
ncbi:MAG: hypothetical protein V4710_04915 [Verrucomicrobiota bacterium]